MIIAQGLTCFLFAATVLLFGAEFGWPTVSAVDLTILEEQRGRDVVRASIQKITESGIFTRDEQILRRIAYAETKDGTRNDTYTPNYHGGIWRLSEQKYNATKRADSILLTRIRDEFNIDWNSTKWRDLRKPFWSALAARLYLEVIPTQIPLSVSRNEQAKYWVKYYTTSNGTESDFLNAIAELAVSEACKISGMDLFFVMDESGSVGFNNFQTMKSFVNEVIEGFEIGSDDVQVGVMTFSNNPKIHFHLNAYGDKSSLKAAVSSLPYRGGGTNTASALDTTRLSAFTEQNGGRPGTSGIPRVVVVITDGHSNSFTNTKVAAARLHEKKIIVFAIGISGANINELNEIASEVRYVEFVSTFDPVRLEALQVEISAEACEASPEIPINDTVNDIIEEGETKYLNYRLPSNTTGITIQINVQSGKIILYASSTTQTPNEANHDVKIVTDSIEDIYIDPKDLRNPESGVVFIALESENATSNVTVEAKEGDVSTEPIRLLISEIHPGVSKDVGGFVSIQCIAAGKPEPTIQWFKDGVHLTPSNKTTVSHQRGGNLTAEMSILQVLYLEKEDTGSYTCLAFHQLPSGPSNASSSVFLDVSGNTIFILPRRGNMLGGTPVRIHGKFFNNLNASVMCKFGELKTPGVAVSESEALCVSPRFNTHGPKRFSLLVNGVTVPANSTLFYATHYSDLADVKVSPQHLIVSSKQELTVQWDNSSLIPYSEEMIKVNIKLFRVDVSFEKALQWTSMEHVLNNDAINNGIASIVLPIFQRERSLPFLTSPYSLVFAKVSLSKMSESSAYYPAIKKLQEMSTKVTDIGIWTHIMFTKRKTTEDGKLCNSWDTNPLYHQNGTSIEATACPCTKVQADQPNSRFDERSTVGKKLLDTLFYGNASTCYDERNPNSVAGGSQECCYDSKGNLIISRPRAGSKNFYNPSSLEKHIVLDIAPYISCCVRTSKFDVYYAKRPSDNCSRFQGQNTGRSTGDPHILTLDGHQYTFNGRGEFILIETANNSFTMQGRMTSIDGKDGKQSLGTVFSALVAKEEFSDTIEFRTGNSLPTVHVNGVEIELERESYEEYSNVTIGTKNDGTLIASFSSGVHLEVKQSNGFLSSISVSVSKFYYGNTRGLMGIYNNDPSDDLMPYGSLVPLPLNSTLERLHHDFGLTWIIDDPLKSLFSYENTNSFQSFYEPKFTPSFAATFTDPVLEQEARTICKGDAMCLFDIAATGRTEIGKDTLEQQVLIQQTSILFSSPIICNPPCVKGSCIANDTCSCQSGYKGALCDIEDICSYNPSPVQCEEVIAGWVYNKDTDKCEFGGCKGRGNIFSTMTNCVKNCGGCSNQGNQTEAGCLVNPCHFSTCRAYPHAKCEVDGCDPCIPRFISGVKEVTDKCEQSCDGNTKIKPTDCVIQPCEVTHCPNFPNAICLPDYCQECKARFYNNFDVEVTDQCTSCSAIKPALKCPLNLCDHLQCTNIPEATCFFDTCGQCKARFYLDDEEVTEQCEECGIQGQVFQNCRPSCQKTCSNYQENLICTQQCQPGCACTNDMVLDELTSKCVLPENCSCHCDPVPENCSLVFVPSGNETCACPVCKDCPEGQIFSECKSCPQTCSEQSNPALSCSNHCTPGCQCLEGQLFDVKSSKCVQNTNCGELDVCSLPPLTGPCKGNIRRYYYNTETKKCEAFRYGGCMGNKNNFFSLHDCEIACSSIPPSCTPLLCVTKRTDTCTLPGTQSGSTSCPDHVVSNCQACFYSPAPLSHDHEAEICVSSHDCVGADGTYDNECLKNWGICMKRSYTAIFRSVPLKERTPENYRCFEYQCKN